MSKRNFFKILAIVFFLLSGIQFILTYNKGLINQTPTKNKPTPSIIKGSEDPTPTNRLNPILSDSIQLYPSNSIPPTQIIVQITNTPIPSNTNVQTPNLGVSTNISVSLSIGGSSVGSFNIPQNSNQCDVLTQALSQGKIQSLNMRYNSDFGTNAVYQINDIGKENAVWWGFKVNGQSPSQGCSYIKVNNGDSILWEYVGN